jgi:hypothetical protein
MNTQQPTSQIAPILYTTRMRDTVLILSSIILGAALIFPSSPYTLLEYLFIGARDFLYDVLFYARVGLYLAVAWFSGVTGSSGSLTFFADVFVATSSWTVGRGTDVRGAG